MLTDKNELRKRFIKIRNEITFLSEKNCQIKRKVLELLQGKGRFSLFSYVSMKSEVDTSEIICELFGKAEIFVPFVEKSKMRAVPLLSLDFSVVDKLGNVYTPENCPQARCDNPEVTLVPMLAFDSGLYRLGYGGGYYDRFLTGSSTLKIGLAFDEQETDEIKIDKYDVPLDIIVTPTRVIRR